MHHLYPADKTTFVQGRLKVVSECGSEHRSPRQLYEKYGPTQYGPRPTRRILLNMGVRATEICTGCFPHLTIVPPDAPMEVYQ